MIRVVIAAALAGGLVLTGGPAAATKPVFLSTGATLPLRTAITSPGIYTGGSAVTAFQLTRAAGATYVKLIASWAAVAPTEPPNPANPASPAYHWATLDTEVERAVHAGLTPILELVNAPAWADVVPPSSTGAGAPSAYQLGQFAIAIATRYDGSNSLPAVHAFEVWNEPNVTVNLSGNSPPDEYRGMVNAVAAAVHGVDPANLVVAGGLDPYLTNSPTSSSTASLDFMDKLLCLSTGTVPQATCSAQTHFDVWSYHPYTKKGGPFGLAPHPNLEITLVNLPSMRNVLLAAVRLQHVVSTNPLQFWTSEFGWDTSPPRPCAAPPPVEARWTSESLHEMWLGGMSLVTWFLLQDQSGTSKWQSGLYFSGSPLASATPKPMVTSFSFPFVAYLNSDGTVSVWGRDPTSSKLPIAIQQQSGGSGPWSTVATIQANPYGIFEATLTLANAEEADNLQAVAPGSVDSLPFSLKPDDPTVSYSPWGQAKPPCPTS